MNKRNSSECVGGAGERSLTLADGHEKTLRVPRVEGHHFFTGKTAHEIIGLIGGGRRNGTQALAGTPGYRDLQPGR